MVKNRGVRNPLLENKMIFDYIFEAHISFNVSLSLTNHFLPQAHSSKVSVCSCSNDRHTRVEPSL
jgi:hypothetical protein